MDVTVTSNQLGSLPSPGAFRINTNPIVLGKSSFESQRQWLDRELSESDATWKIVAGHHPCLSGGEHDLQLIDSGHGWQQLICGSGSKLRSTSWIDETEFAAATSGFAWLLIQNGQLSISFFSSQERLYTKVIPQPKSSGTQPQSTSPIASAEVAFAL